MTAHRAARSASHDAFDEAAIRTLVKHFYRTVVQDPLLGPIFQTRMGGRWDAHLDRMCDFWSTVLLGTRRFNGDPMGAHVAIPGLSGDHFDRWITLFEEAAGDCLSPPLAADIVARARRMRVAIERHIEAVPGVA